MQKQCIKEIMHVIILYKHILEHKISTIGDQGTFQKHLYLCILGQALQLKSQIEGHRSSNTFGDLIWQLNEIWPTGGWGSIEYGTPLAGQVVGGRWKPLQYFMRKLIYHDNIIACGVDNYCYVRNDGKTSNASKIVTSILRFADGAIIPVSTTALTVPVGQGHIQWLCASANDCATYDSMVSKASCKNGRSSCLLLASVLSNDGTVLTENVVLLIKPSGLQLPTAKVNQVINGTNITLSTNATALYVILTTAAPGRFSDNAFYLLPTQPKQIEFVPFGSFDSNLLAATLRVEHLQQYLTA